MYARSLFAGLDCFLVFNGSFVATKKIPCSTATVVINCYAILILTAIFLCFIKVGYRSFVDFCIAAVSITNLAIR